MEKKEKTNTVMLWIAVLVLSVSLMIDAYFDCRIHQSLHFQQQDLRETFLEHQRSEQECLHRANQSLEQILNIVDGR